jgi:hypothetical protein
MFVDQDICQDKKIEALPLILESEVLILFNGARWGTPTMPNNLCNQCYKQ